LSNLIVLIRGILLLRDFLDRLLDLIVENQQADVRRVLHAAVTSAEEKRSRTKVERSLEAERIQNGFAAKTESGQAGPVIPGRVDPPDGNS
jgi:hypothetical protein